ncbi:3-keto-5-aminohexanoate cleavage protein [Sedimentitalea nanhaiensis]|uniref:Uncharacterized conserved protein, DUF849 family n=1 Tax=Sedimentitalea nanhaiensis TaxID=999627 RepID=A0A1I7E9R0_9RHOB|nr:3-keto-5-aminohexanoate cleavage protein [Sedimentitalea nanhaiensis]SFU20661.1 Uncharacterized conserved protein, DUF849 family [Sedimentitalea nanhaiensis]
MIVQACLNGARPIDYHPRLPLTIEAMATEARACILAGAGEIHVHPRGAQRKESLAAVDDTIRALRAACPGSLIGVSTGAWIENDEKQTREQIAAWRELPDYASVNLSEPDADAVMELLLSVGVGIEAGLASVADADRFVRLASSRRALRILLEIEEQDLDEAFQVADGIVACLEKSGLRRPVLLHGFDATVWPFVDRAAMRGWSTRVGLEDGKCLPDGAVARDNAELVAAAINHFAEHRARPLPRGVG